MKYSSFLKTLLLATTTISTSATLAEKGTPGSGPNPYSDCGIGAALFPKVKWAAVTSNVIWDIGTTAVTSATASPETCSGKSVETALFIHRTYDELVEETAAGTGEHVTAMLNLMACPVESHPAVSSAIRETMASVLSASDYPQQSRLEKSSRYYDIMAQAISTNCGPVGA